MTLQDIPLAFKVLMAQECKQALPMPEAIEAVRRVLMAQKADELVVPQRTIVDMTADADRTQILLMPSASRSSAKFVVKLSAIAPRNRHRGLPLVSAVIIILDAETGRLNSILDGAHLTAVRTAAASAVATNCLARADACELALIGAGATARAHIESMSAVRNIARLTLFSRTKARAEALADWAVENSLCQTAEVVDTAEAAVGNADIVCTTTSITFEGPILDLAWLKDGTHVNAIGGVDENAMEIEPRSLAGARVVVEEVDAVFRESGELRKARALGLLDENSVVRLCDVVAAPHTMLPSGRISVFKSVGVAFLDFAVAEGVSRAALQMGLGREVLG